MARRVDRKEFLPALRAIWLVGSITGGCHPRQRFCRPFEAVNFYSRASIEARSCTNAARFAKIHSLFGPEVPTAHGVCLLPYFSSTGKPRLRSSALVSTSRPRKRRKPSAGSIVSPTENTLSYKLFATLGS